MGDNNVFWQLVFENCKWKVYLKKPLLIRFFMCFFWYFFWCKCRLSKLLTYSIANLTSWSYTVNPKGSSRFNVLIAGKDTSFFNGDGDLCPWEIAFLFKNYHKQSLTNTEECLNIFMSFVWNPIRMFSQPSVFFLKRLVRCRFDALSEGEQGCLSLLTCFTFQRHHIAEQTLLFVI